MIPGQGLFLSAWISLQAQSPSDLFSAGRTYVEQCWMRFHQAGMGNVCWKHISSSQVCYCVWIMERGREWTTRSSGWGHGAKFSQHESAVTPPAPARWVGVMCSFPWRKALFTPVWVRRASALWAPPLPSQRVGVWAQGILDLFILKRPPI